MSNHKSLPLIVHEDELHCRNTTNGCMQPFIIALSKKYSGARYQGSGKLVLFTQYCTKYSRAYERSERSNSLGTSKLSDVCHLSAELIKHSAN
jgi:hypothetical protein